MVRRKSRKKKSRAKVRNPHPQRAPKLPSLPTIVAGPDGRAGIDISKRRLLNKHQVEARTGKSFPTIWKWMRAGTFPRSFAVGGRTMWFEDEVDAWFETLPMVPYKGDKVEANA